MWQNRTLLGYTKEKLENAKFNVLLHGKVPTNDGGIALGQAVILQHIMKEKK